MDQTVSERITPSTAEVAVKRSELISLLSDGPLSKDAALEQISPLPSLASLSVPEGEPSDVLVFDHPDVAAVRHRNAAIAALHQLEHDRLIESPPVGVDLKYGTVLKGAARHGSTDRDKRISQPIGMQTGTAFVTRTFQGSTTTFPAGVYATPNFMLP